MSDRLIVEFAAKNKYQSLTCYEVTEGEHGIHLEDSFGDQLGYVPYEQLEFVGLNPEASDKEE
ncbi:hypothetical protein [Natrinema sp. SYSU A 869]|uniref:hypothetical protein n=1 Tax=Natrinema sp. SYSU A 869 TaxID=2871694 RepID=UPI001CA45172|nr:hypothetical protein [Natrinema sp. SYSU A 869]